VTVDGEVVTDPARGVDPRTQDIRLDSERLRRPKFRYFLVNKPKGVLCTNRDPQGRPRAVDLVPVSEQRMFTVGRLDENTEGMLLITNDGDLAQKLAHPRFEVIRRYRCHVAGIPQPETLNQLRDGMYFAEGYFKFRSVHIYQRRGQSVILELELQEGKNREIRRLMARVGHKVLALERVAFGPLTLGNLAPGRHRELQPFEIHELRHFAEHGEKPEPRGAKPGDRYGYRSGQTRSKRRTPSANRERSPRREVNAESPVQALGGPRPAGPRTAVDRQAGSGTASSRPARQKPDGQKPAGQKSAGTDSTTRKVVIQKTGPRTSGAKKSGAKKPFRPATGKPAAAPINKGRDRRKNR
jgi:23S rRNA pseudouridine2605 synthase